MGVLAEKVILDSLKKNTQSIGNQRADLFVY